MTSDPTTSGQWTFLKSLIDGLYTNGNGVYGMYSVQKKSKAFVFFPYLSQFLNKLYETFTEYLWVNRSTDDNLISMQLLKYTMLSNGSLNMSTYAVFWKLNKLWWHVFPTAV